MKEIFRDMWNVFGLDNEEVIELINRTSNSLERYNRRMKYDVFRVQHPSLMKFVEGLYAEGTRQVKRIEDVRKGREVPRELTGVTFPPIPPEYYEYREGIGKGNKKGAKKRTAPLRVNPKRKGKK